MGLSLNANSTFNNLTLAYNSQLIFFISEMQCLTSKDFLGLTEKLKEQRHFRFEIAPTEQ